jgi:hypothetical protein
MDTITLVTSIVGTIILVGALCFSIYKYRMSQKNILNLDIGDFKFEINEIVNLTDSDFDVHDYFNFYCDFILSNNGNGPLSIVEYTLEGPINYYNEFKTSYSGSLYDENGFLLNCPFSLSVGESKKLRLKVIPEKECSEIQNDFIKGYFDSGKREFIINELKELEDKYGKYPTKRDGRLRIESQSEKCVEYFERYSIEIFFKTNKKYIIKDKAMFYFHKKYQTDAFIEYNDKSLKPIKPINK